MPDSQFSGSYDLQDLDGIPFTRAVLRLDVDGAYPLMAASGVGSRHLGFSVHWLAERLVIDSTANVPAWSGEIRAADKWRPSVDGRIWNTLIEQAAFPYGRIRLERHGGLLSVILSGDHVPDAQQQYVYRSPFFHEVEFEFDVEDGLELQLQYDTHSHPDRPGFLLPEAITIEKVFQRAGFDVKRTGGDSRVVSGSGGDTAWSDGELHDAMRIHFSKIANLNFWEREKAQWAIWTFFAGRHEEGSSVGGKMFDTFGTAHRQGTAVFVNSFLSQPGDDPHPDAWIRRMIFWSAIHEMGHGFNLKHSWLKQGSPWREQEHGYHLLSFMNYPDNFGNGAFMRSNAVRFFRQFEFRFTNAELLFLRHAPDSFVQMGGANFGANHALEQANVSPIPTFEFTLRTGRSADEFEFLEPVVVELKLTNQSDQPQLIPDDVLDHGEELALIVRKRYGQPMLFAPFVHSYRKPRLIVLKPAGSVYASRFISSGTYGWMIDEPGWYEIRACLQLENEDILSNVLTIRIAPPRNWDEEYVAQDFFSDGVAVALSFDGSRTLDHANAVLQEAVARFPERRVAIHANVALQMPDIGYYKRFRQAGGRYAIEESSPAEAACADLSKTLAGSDQQALTAAEALGNIDFCHYMERLAAAAKDCDQIERAVEILDCLAGTCRKRRVLKTVQRRIRDKLKRLKAEEEGEDID